MSELPRDGVWLVVAMMMGILALSQCRVAGALEAELSTVREARSETTSDEGALVDAVRARHQELIDAARWLHLYYQSEAGLQRPEGLWGNGEPDFDGLVGWLVESYLFSRLAGVSDAEAKARIVAAIQTTDEWRAKHGGP